jgi:hypothetical protein
VLAETEQQIERNALQAIAELILAATEADVAREEPANAATPRIPSAAAPAATHPRCGTALRPQHTEMATCARTGLEVAMSSDIRGRIATARQLRSATRLEKRVRTLLTHREAHSTNRLIFGATILAVSVWPVLMGWRLARISLASGINVFEWLLVPFLGIGIVIGMVLFLRACLVQRRMIQTVILGFRARTSDTTFGAPSCRQCLEPLPPSMRIVVTCAYCAADNVLGVVIGGDAAVAQPREVSLARALRASDRECCIWAGAALVVTALFAAGLWHAQLWMLAVR